MAVCYAGNILYVDLTTGRVESRQVAPSCYDDYLGGFGLSAYLAYKELASGIEPLDSKNAIILGAGLFNGTGLPSSSRFFATTKFPATGAIGAAAGGGFGFMLKAAGYDQAVITGKAAVPSILVITDDGVELKPAGHLWGQEIFATTYGLRQIHGDEAQIIAIGPAGERLVRFSFSLVNNISTLGRGGLGAIMGAKHLKAVVALGKKPVAVAKPQEFDKRAASIQAAMAAISYRFSWLKYGPGVARFLAGRKGYLSHNYQELDVSQKLEQAFGPAAYETLWQATRACPSCPVGCKSLIKLGELVVPFSAALAAAEIWGARFNLNSLEAAIRLRERCNRNGLDDRMAAGLIDLAVELYEAGVLTRSDADGLELRRDQETASLMLEKIISREGLGDILAEGYQGTIKAFGKEAQDRAVQIKGLDPYRDPRELFDGMAVTQVVNPRGSYGVPGNSPGYLPGRGAEQFSRYLRRIGAPEEAVKRICPSEGVDMGRLAKYAEDWYALCSCLGICVRQPVSQVYSLKELAELYLAATGVEREPEELLRAGERAWNLFRVINAREGFSRRQDAFPEAFYQPLEEDGRKRLLQDYSGRPLNREDVDKLFQTYYEERGWSVEDGLPTTHGLRRLGLDFASQEEGLGLAGPD